MSEKPAWYYDEFKQIGTDYNSIDEVRQYDERMHKLRDIPKEVANTITLLGITPESTMIEFGCGTCELSIAAARLCRKVHAVDISEMMLDYAHAKVKSRNIDNIEFHRAGFLSYEHIGESVDIVATQLAFHHLPDFWKVVALGRIHDMLKPGGRLFIRDVVFSFPPGQYEKVLDAWVEAVGPENATNCQNHIREEHSTMSWLLEEMFKQTGFKIISADYTGGVFGVYLCEKAE